MREELQDLSRVFSRAATGYQQNSTVQRRISYELSRFFPKLDSTAEPILEIGAGTGHLTTLLAEAYSGNRFIASDLSRSLIVANRNVVARSAHQRDSIQCDMSRLPFPASFSLIASNAALHWASSPDEVCSQIAAALTPKGFFVASVMTFGTCAELHDIRAEIAPGKMSQRVLPDDDRWFKALECSGFEIECSDLVSLQEWYPSAAQAVKGLHDAGLTGGSVSRSIEPLTRRELTALYALYDERYGCDARVPVSFRALLFRACKRM